MENTEVEQLKHRLDRAEYCIKHRRPLAEKESKLWWKQWIEERDWIQLGLKSGVLKVSDGTFNRSSIPSFPSAISPGALHFTGIRGDDYCISPSRSNKEVHFREVHWETGTNGHLSEDEIKKLLLSAVECTIKSKEDLADTLGWVGILQEEESSRGSNPIPSANIRNKYG